MSAHSSLESSADSSDQQDRIDLLVEEFLIRSRKEKTFTIEQFVAEHPDDEDEIMAVLPALMTLEQLKPAADPQSESSHIETKVPTQIGDYRIVREIGRGGMGVVYEAEQLSLGRRVALKVMPPHLFSAESQLLRFERESKAAGKLHHTNIVPVFGVGEVDGVHFYVMQYIDGVGLNEVVDELRRQRMKPGHTDNSFGRSVST